MGSMEELQILSTVVEGITGVSSPRSLFMICLITCVLIFKCPTHYTVIVVSVGSVEKHFVNTQRTVLRLSSSSSLAFSTPALMPFATWLCAQSSLSDYASDICISPYMSCTAASHCVINSKWIGLRPLPTYNHFSRCRYEYKNRKMWCGINYFNGRRATADNGVVSEEK